MLTNRDAIYQIKNLAEQSQITRDGWSDIWIYKELLKYRARIINQKLENNIPISKFNYQDIPCVKLIEVDSSECACSIDSNCKLFKSEFLLPKMIRVMSVYNPINTKQYSLTDITKVRHRQNTRFNYINNKSFSYISDTGKGSYLYVVSDNPLLNSVAINAIVYDPIEAQRYPDCNNEIKFPCRSFYDYEFKLDENLFATVSEMMLQYFYKLKFGAQDIKNNHIVND